MDALSIPDLVSRMSSDEDAVRKMAVFKLQTSIGDPSFADVFIQEGGLASLRNLLLSTTGNTLAYSLTSFARLLDVDMGWEAVDQEMVERVVELIVTHPLVNILRGAMAILVSIVSRPYNLGHASPTMLFGFRALRPAIAVYPQFLEMLVSRLSSADHALCANALQLINALMRDAITSETETEWPKLIKRLQDLGVIRAVYNLMQGTALQDLAHPLLEFQALTKVLLRKWKEVVVELDKPEHRRALKGIHLASNPDRMAHQERTTEGETKRKHNPEKWRRLGFQSESPSWDFQDMGFLGMMDLTDYVKKHQDDFQRILLEQSTKPTEQRCPIARASLAVTGVLYEHFEVDKSDLEDSKAYLALESRSNFDKVFKPLLLHWSRLHVAGLHAFLRLWKSTSAELEDFNRILDLIRILIESVVGAAPRWKDLQDVEEELADFDCQRLRELQMELLELTYEDTWGHHLRQVRNELQHEALQFVKEQRIRCLAKGGWFPTEENREVTSWRFAQLSHNRRYLHFGDFTRREENEPDLDSLPNKIDLSIVSSITNKNIVTQADSDDEDDADINDRSQTPTLRNTKPTSKQSTKAPRQPRKASNLIITILGSTSVKPSSADASSTMNAEAPSSPRPPRQPKHAHSHSARSVNTVTTSTVAKDQPLLVLRPTDTSMASEWLDGLLMLLNQQPITSTSNKLVDMIAEYGLKIRLLNVRFDAADGLLASDEKRGQDGVPEVPSREGLDEDYHYDVFGGG